MARIMLFFVLTCLSATAAFAHVGVVTEVTGSIELQRGEEVFTVESGVDIMPGDLLRSNKESSVQVDMDDGSILSIGANSTLQIDDYKLREDKSVISASIALVSGWLRFAVAKLHQQDSSYRFHMPTAVLGVRGTEGVLEVTGEGDKVESRVMLEEGKVDVAEEVRKGQLRGARVVLRSGQYASRRRGRLLKMLRRAPFAFRNRMPARLRIKLVRRIRMLKRRGVPPRRIRGMLRHKMQRHLRQEIRQKRMRKFKHTRQKTTQKQRFRQQKMRKRHQRRHP
ncbi:MAG: FecR family protein [Mariprofundaceae bacterium]|nr:FecR family protein [Mariprofundaceae bacterium]